MQDIILYSSLFTLGYFVAQLLRGKRISGYILVYLFIYFFLWGLFINKISAGEPLVYCGHTVAEGKYPKNKEEFFKMRDHYIKKVEWHERQARHYFLESKKKCWYMPTIDMQSDARELYCYFLAHVLHSCTAGDPRSVLMTMCLNGLQYIGVRAMKEWDDIEHDLRCARYHYEMCEFYGDVIINELPPIQYKFRL